MPSKFASAEAGECEFTVAAKAFFRTELSLNLRLDHAGLSRKIRYFWPTDFLNFG